MAGPVIPETRYAQSGDLAIAYRVAGAGPVDVVFVPGFVSNVDLLDQVPGLGDAMTRVQGFGRIVAFDKRGTGLSDAVPRLPTLEETMDDVGAVMDAVGMEHAALLGLSEGGSVSALFAATHPERVDALVLWASFACNRRTPDNPDGLPPEVAERVRQALRETWGTGLAFAAVAFQDAFDDPDALDLLARYERGAATPSTAAAAIRFALECDVRDVLPAITAPTLVLHRTGDPLVRVTHARYLAEHIDGARLAELPGDFHVGGRPGDNDDLFDEVEEFLTGVRPERAESVERVLKTVLFTDIVGSTERAAELGDRRWKEILDAHDAAVRRALARHGGHEVNTTGDGFLATFDGPARAIRCGQGITGEAQQLGMDVRVGVHTGECEVRGDDFAGIALHVGARVAALAGPSEVLVTSTVRDLVLGAGIDFADRGVRALKGVPGEWHLLAVQP